MAKSKDLFDDSTMTFGEHLEVLRIHLWRCILWLAVFMIGTLFVGGKIVDFVRAPIDKALTKYNLDQTVAGQSEELEEFSLTDYVGSWFGFGDDEEEEGESKKEGESKSKKKPAPEIEVSVNAYSLMAALNEIDPDQFKRPRKELKEKSVELTMSSEKFESLAGSSNQSGVVGELKPVTLTVQEAFMMYLKVAFVSGLVFASPFIFWELWNFVKVGLYPHERKYVHFFIPLSLFLFLGGAAFCFYFVFPFVLDFLLGFNAMLEVTPQIRLSEWISFAIMMPVMFGISFQLPLVMLLLERLQIVDVAAYKSKRRMAILVIAILSMFLTPADPMSMMLMMLPLILLYEFGIWLCMMSPARSPFEEAEAA